MYTDIISMRIKLYIKICGIMFRPVQIKEGVKYPSLLFPILFAFFFIFAQDDLFSEASSPFKKMDTSYAALGLGQEFAYFLSVREAASGTYVLLKLPIDNHFGIEPVYCHYKKPAADYSAGTNSFIPVGGTEEYHDIRLNLLYYFWFLKNLQFKAGVNYSKFIRGNFIIDPSLENCGTVMNMCRRSREHFYSFNMGLNLDLPVYKYILLMSNITYRIFLSDNTTRGGALNFGIGAGLKLFSISGEKSSPDDFASRETPDRTGRKSAETAAEKRTERSAAKEEKKEKAPSSGRKEEKAAGSEKKVPVKTAQGKKEEVKKTVLAQKEKIEEPLKKETEKEKKTESNQEAVQKAAEKTNTAGIENEKTRPEVTAVETNRTNLSPLPVEEAKAPKTEEMLEKTNVPPITEKPVAEGTGNITNKEPLPPLPDIGISADVDEFSPDGDGVKDTISFIPRATASGEIKEWNILIRDDKNKPVKNFTGSGTPPPKIEWNGLDDKGERVPGRSSFLYALRVRDRLEREQETPPKQFRTGHYLIKQDNGFRIAMENVQFDFNRYEIKSEFYPVLDRAIEILKSENFLGRKVSIEGHTDNFGTEERNIVLSQNRARAVMDYLTGKGVDPKRLSIKGFGEKKPVAANETEEGRFKNRRTEIIIK